MNALWGRLMRGERQNILWALEKAPALAHPVSATQAVQVKERSRPVLAASVASCFCFTCSSSSSCRAVLPYESKPERLYWFYSFASWCFSQMGGIIWRNVQDWGRLFWSKMGDGSLQLEEEGWLLPTGAFRSAENLRRKPVWERGKMGRKGPGGKQFQNPVSRIWLTDI